MKNDRQRGGESNSFTFTNSMPIHVHANAQNVIHGSREYPIHVHVREKKAIHDSHKRKNIHSRFTKMGHRDPRITYQLTFCWLNSSGPGLCDQNRLTKQQHKLAVQRTMYFTGLVSILTDASHSKFYSVGLQRKICTLHTVAKEFKFRSGKTRVPIRNGSHNCFSSPLTIAHPREKKHCNSTNVITMVWSSHDWSRLG